MIEIKGRIPSKKNSTWTLMIKGRSVRLPSQKYKEWHKDASLQLRGVPPIPPLKVLIVDFYLPDKRKTDLSNKIESLCDLLVDNGIIPDDNCGIVPQLLLTFKGVDPQNPRAIIQWRTSPIELSSE